MKADIHPEYKEVVFQDVTSDFKFLTRSTLGSTETITWEDGNEYPLIQVDVSSATPPFSPGQTKTMHTSVRVAKFRNRYAQKAARSASVMLTPKADEDARPPFPPPVSRLDPAPH